MFQSVIYCFLTEKKTFLEKKYHRIARKISGEIGDVGSFFVHTCQHFGPLQVIMLNIQQLEYGGTARYSNINNAFKLLYPSHCYIFNNIEHYLM